MEFAPPLYSNDSPWCKPITKGYVVKENRDLVLCETFLQEAEATPEKLSQVVTPDMALDDKRILSLSYVLLHELMHLIFGCM